MPRATCRCGQTLNLPDDGTDRTVCPRCGARVRLRRRDGAAGDGFIRFFCPCGRRLKVGAETPPSHGKCPECGRVVPVPAGNAGPPAGHPNADTTELTREDLAALERWSRDHEIRASNARQERTPVVALPAAGAGAGPAPVRAEAGLRVCPNCHKPVHLGADACRACGTPVPRR